MVFQFSKNWVDSGKTRWLPVSVVCWHKGASFTFALIAQVPLYLTLFPLVLLLLFPFSFLSYSATLKVLFYAPVVESLVEYCIVYSEKFSQVNHQQCNLRFDHELYKTFRKWREFPTGTKE